ncbi:polysaccharide deacetylase family protein [Paucilactobacillus suebicus]|uniref:polysaccharide deacetylase family protein n=1 Tax=Paucilactobacillus suebicus TaxID=152335 RepID=UPI0002490260|nr:polysaccharide deacetylase family protein [Paucilactobacillus suebicus]
MTKTTRKWILGIFIVFLLSALSFEVHKQVKFELGNRESYALSKKDEQTKNGIIVFCYHRVLNNNSTVKTVEKLSPNNQLHVYNVNLSTFKNQMNFLQKHHIKVISTTQMASMLQKHREVRGKYVVITFDDVDRTLAENAAPVLEKHHYPFTASIITGNTGRYREGEQLATWPQIIKMKKQAGNLLELGVHTNNMHYLTPNGTAVFNIPKNFSRFKKDFKTSELVMKKESGSKTPIFTYPYGSGDPQVEKFLTDQPILKVIYTLNNGIVTSRENLSLTPRVIINHNSWPSVSKWLSTK